MGNSFRRLEYVSVGRKLRILRRTLLTLPKEDFRRHRDRFNREDFRRHRDRFNRMVRRHNEVLELRRQRDTVSV